MGVNNLFLSDTWKDTKTKENSETFYEGKVTMISGYVSAAHLRIFSVMILFIKFVR